MVSGRHGKPTVTGVPRGADCSVSAGDAYICMLPLRAAQALTGPDRRTAAPLLIFCLPALWAKLALHRGFELLTGVMSFLSSK